MNATPEIEYDHNELRSSTSNELPRTVSIDPEDVGDKLQIEDRSTSTSEERSTPEDESLLEERSASEDESLPEDRSASEDESLPEDRSASEDESLSEDRSASDVAAGSASNVETFDFQAFLNKESPISDEKYIEEMELQEALLMSTAASLAPAESGGMSLSADNLSFFPYSSAEYAMSSSTNQPFTPPPVKCESTQEPDKFCGICMDTKTEDEMFINVNVCGHTFCIDCIKSHVGATVNENIAIVRCPDPNCKGLIGPSVCQYILPKEVLERWDHALCESLITGSQKLYCPYKDCSAPLLMDPNGVPTKDTECPHCNRMFCAQCKVPWHSEITCKEFQMINENGDIDQGDIKALRLAKEQNWQRCPKCGYYVARTEGCNHMKCRCGHNFCYKCGSSRGGCSCGE